MISKTKEPKLISGEDRTYRTKKLAILGLITAMAYVAVMIFRLPIIPAVPFLDLEFKSAIIMVGAFIFGPLSGFAITAAVCLVEMFTISDTGIIGCIMNIIATGCFVCPAALIYKNRRTVASAVAGLAVGTVATTVAMILWNYIVTPMYMNVQREAVVSLLIPAFIPFNLLKAAINGGIVLVLYKPIVSALRKQNLIPESKASNSGGAPAIAGAIITGCMVLLTCVLIVLAFNGII